MTIPTWTLEEKNMVITKEIYDDVNIVYDDANVQYGGVNDIIWTEENKNT